MKSKRLLSVLGVLWFLCLGLTAKGYTPITITGPGTVCAGNSGSYSISPTASYHYQWSVTAQGNFSGASTGSSVNILWGTAGTATVTVDGYDSSNTLQQVGTLTVNVAPLPTPYITTNQTVGCQTYAGPPKDREGQPPIPGNPYIIDDTSGCPKVCDSSVVTYTANGPAGSTYGWTVSGGTIITASGNTCTVFWNGPVGFANISVSDTSMYGCVGTKSVCLQLIPKPHAGTIFPGLVCVNQSVLFFDLAWADPTSPIVSWLWDFGDGSIFTSASSTTATHTYLNPGHYMVTQVVRNQCGCTDTFRLDITVSPDQGVSIVCPGVICDSSTATYRLQPAVSCSPYSWHVAGGIITSGIGTPTITVLWTHVDTTGFGYVTFDPSGCGIPCTAPTTIKVPVITPHGTISGPKVVCPYAQYLYSLPQWPTTTFTWTVLTSTGATAWPTDQNNQIALNVFGPGTIILKCVYQNTLLGCGGIAYDTITVQNPDFIVGNTSQCFGSTGTYTMNSGLPATWTMTAPDNTVTTSTGTSFTQTFSQVGTYSLNAVGNFCLSDALTIRVDTLPPPPNSISGPDTVCFGTPVDFSATTAIAGTSFAWAISSGSVHFPNGDHTTAFFSGASPDTIMVWRESSSGAHCHSDTLRHLVYQPYVDVHITGQDTVCPNSIYSYDAGYANGESYTWTIISGPTLASVQTNGHSVATVLFNNQSGVVKLQVAVTKCSTTYYDTTIIYILPTPTLAITDVPDSVCRDAFFTAILTGASGGTVTWNWGDGTPDGSGFSAGHSYTTLASSDFNVTINVTVTGVYGCIDTFHVSKNVTVLPAPVANITPNGPFYICTGTPSQLLTATLAVGYGATNELQWWASGSLLPFADCTPPTCTSQTITAIGDYFVVAVGTNGCKDTSNVVSFIHYCPDSCVISGNPGDAITGTNDCGTVHLVGTTSGSATPFSYAWSWPIPQMHGETHTNTTLDGYFTLAGLYNFSYTVGFADALGDTCYKTAFGTVLVPLVAQMGHMVTCNAPNYNLTLLDNSNFFPGHAPTAYSWYINGVYQATTGTPSYTTTRPPGSYTLSEWVHYDGTDSCLATDSVYLDPIPHAAFTFARDTTCVNDASVQFTNLSTPSSGLSYFWTFGDAPPGNTQPNPWKVYGSSGLFNVTLTVTNQYGCSSAYSLPVPIHAEDLFGQIEASDSIACGGSPVTLTYNPNVGFPKFPLNYYWVNGTDTILVNTSPTANIYTSGSYWVIGTDQYGCVVKTDHQSVAFTTVPNAVITGDTSQCINTPYTLNGYAGSDSTITYTWIKDGSVVGSNQATYTDPAFGTGTFTYYLVVSVPNGSGGYCTDTSAAFVVTVHGLPSAPSINYSLVDCNTYTLKLNATGPSYGSYNWSNGMSGQTISVPEAGGPYAVTYTDTFGCSSTGNGFVPRDPRLYLWVFPSGCYGPYCAEEWEKLGPTIVGPIEPFNYWGYLEDPSGVIPESGTFSPVSPFVIPGSGVYQLILDNGICRDSSADMNIAIKDCAPCQNGKVQTVLRGITQGGCDDTLPASPADTCCHWYITLQFTNGYGIPMNVNISADQGSMDPGGTVVLPGTSMHTFQFLRNPGFNGGPVTLYISYTDPNTGQEILCTLNIVIPACKQIDPRIANGEASVNGDAGMMLVPNPAQDDTRVDYHFPGDAANSSVEVYDMTGRLVSRQALAANSGSCQLQLSNYTPGIYIVVLRQHGNAILEARLSVVH